MRIKVLGAGCKNCKRLLQLVEKAVEEEGFDAEIHYITDVMEIAKANLLRTPGLIIDNKIVSYGRIPSSDEIKAWLKG